MFFNLLWLSLFFVCELFVCACGKGCPFGFDRLRGEEQVVLEPAGRHELVGQSFFLDGAPYKTCSAGYCTPASGNNDGGYFFTSDGTTSNNSDVCIDIVPESLLIQPNNQSQAEAICLELAYNRSCELPDFVNGKYCARSCGICNQPIYADGSGAYSGADQLLLNGLYNSSRFLNTKIPRKQCNRYDVNAVVNAIKDWASTNPPNIDIPKLVRAAFHDAADYNKWAGTGGPDGNYS